MIGLHMLNSLSGAATANSSSAASGKALSQKQLHKLQQQAQYEHQQANIVRISAKTAQPIAVSSVPKCRQVKGLRSHPLDTINGTNSGRPLMSEQVRPVSGRASGAGRRSMSMDQLAQQAGDDGDQRVLLIVNEDHIRGGGVPIIGRRLPSKSMALQSSRVQIGYPVGAVDVRFAATTNAEYPLEPPAIRMDQIQAAPIVGRRSHRLQLGHQEQYEYHDANRGDSQQQTGGGSSNNNNRHYKQQQQAANLQQLASSQAGRHHLLAQAQMLSNDQQQVASMQLLQQQQQAVLVANLAGGSGSGQQGGARRKLKSVAASKQSAGSSSLVERRLVGGGDGGPKVADLASQAKLQSHHHQLQRQRQFALDELQSASKSTKKQVSSGGGRGRRIVADSAQTAAVVASSCSSLCELQQQQQQQQQCYEANCCCCSATCDSPAEFGARNDEAAINGCQKACRRPSSSPFSASSGCNLARSASCQRITIPSCCANVGGMLTKPQVAATNCDTRCHHHQHQQQKQQLPQSSHHHQHHHQRHHHQSCQANGSHEANDNSSRRQHSSMKAQVQPMHMSGRNVLPVAPKPIVNYQRPPPSATTIVLAAGRAPEQEKDEQEDPVAHMYESLAAELKAKLGNPKFGPILLPPKDYDTMSRKQGKLSGIELRRSTNPQLVGPTVNAQRPSQVDACEESSKQQQANGDYHTRRPAPSCSTSGAHACCCCNNSARSSCRSSCHTQTADDSGSSSSARSATSCLQRSRSNSSSGLGSISVGAGSPNSSPSSKCSSSEDMRHAAHTKATKKALTSAAASGGRANDETRDGKHPMKVGAKNCSPDNFASSSSSDSGHSGSGRLENRAYGGRTSTSTTTATSNSCCFSNEEQRIMLRDTSSSDDFLNSKASDADARLTNGSNNRGKGIESHNPAKVSDGVLWNGRVEIPLKINSDRNGNTYLATKQIIY